MTSTVKRSVPPPALVKMGNPLVRMLLGSPLHGVLDGSFLVLHLTGRKTGRRYNIPVGYVDMEGRLAVVAFILVLVLNGVPFVGLRARA